MPTLATGFRPPLPPSRCFRHRGVTRLDLHFRLPPFFSDGEIKVSGGQREISVTEQEEGQDAGNLMRGFA
jgi:hypothetical protein